MGLRRIEFDELCMMRCISMKVTIYDELNLTYEIYIEWHQNITLWDEKNHTWTRKSIYYPVNKTFHIFLRKNIYIYEWVRYNYRILNLISFNNHTLCIEYFYTIVVLNTLVYPSSIYSYFWYDAFDMWYSTIYYLGLFIKIIHILKHRKMWIYKPDLIKWVD